jgi:hypothetical protein
VSICNAVNFSQPRCTHQCGRSPKRPKSI